MTLTMHTEGWLYTLCLVCSILQIVACYIMFLLSATSCLLVISCCFEFKLHVFPLQCRSRGPLLIDHLSNFLFFLLPPLQQMANRNSQQPGSQQQPLRPCQHARNALLQQAQSILVVRNWDKAEKMRADISTVWDHVDNAAIDIGKKYNKTVVSVQ